MVDQRATTAELARCSFAPGGPLPSGDRLDEVPLPGLAARQKAADHATLSGSVAFAVGASNALAVVAPVDDEAYQGPRRYRRTGWWED